MELQIWETTIITWVNSLGIWPPIHKIGQFKDHTLERVSNILGITEDSQQTFINFLNEVFPNFVIENVGSPDLLCTATFFLIFVSFSSKTELEVLKQSMCSKLDNSVQIYIADFLMGIQKYGDVFKISTEIVKEEIHKFVQSHTAFQHSMIGDGIKVPGSPMHNSPLKMQSDSPLLEFFQTPKKKLDNKREPCSQKCVKQIKDLRAQLVEEELERASLQEKLNKRISKCSDLESRLKDKMNEIRHLKSEWEIEAKKNDDEIKSLHYKLGKKLTEEQQLKGEVTSLENYVTNLQRDLTTALNEKLNAEKELKKLLEKCEYFETQVRESSEEVTELQTAVSNKELELLMMKENFRYANCDESIECSFVEGPFNVTPLMPETMDIVIDKKLSEQVSENATLRESIDELMSEKNKLRSDVSELLKKLSAQTFEMSALQNLTKELETRCHDFDKVREELEEAQQKLTIATKEIHSMSIENKQLKAENSSQFEELSQRYKELSECKASNELLIVDIKKLTEEFQNAQKHLEQELENVSRLTLETEEKHLQLKKSIETLSEVQSDHNSAKKSLEYVECNLSKNLGRLGGMLKETESEGKSTESFLSCFSVENKLDKLTDLLGKLESQNLESAASRASLEKTCVQLNESIVCLKSEISELEEKQRGSLKERTELETCLLRAEEKISDLQSVYSSKIDALKEELEEKANKIIELDNVVIQSNLNQQKLLSEKEVLSQELQKLKDQCSQTKDTIEDLELELVNRENDHIAKASAMSEALEELKKNFDILSQKNAHLNVVVSEKGKKLIETQEEIKQLNESHKKTIQEQKTVINDKDVQIHNSKTATKKLKYQISSLEAELKKTANDKVELRKCLDFELEKTDARLEEKNLEIKSLKDSIRVLQSQVTNLTEEKEDLNAELNETNRALESSKETQVERETESTLKIRELSGRIISLEEKIDIAEKEKEETVNYMEELKEKLRRSENERKDLEKENSEHRRQYAAKISELNKMEDDLFAFKALKDSWAKEYERKDIELNKIKGIKENLEQTIQRIDSENKMLNEKLDCNELELAKMKGENSVLISSNARCQESIEENKREMEELSRQHHTLSTTCKKMEEERERILLELNQVKDQLEVARCDLANLNATHQKSLSEAVAKIQEAKTERETKILELRDMQVKRDELARSLNTATAELSLVKASRESLLEEKEKLAAKSKETAEKATRQLQDITSQLEEEIARRSLVELKLNEERKSVESLSSQVEDLEGHREKIRQLSREMKSNVTILKILLNRANPKHGQDSSKELQVLYDSCKEITDSASQLSVGDDVEQSDYITVTDGRHSDVNLDENPNVEIEMEELNEEIITAKRNLIAFLQASKKHFEVLKIKENLVNEMSKQQQSLDNRIMSLTELNTRLTKEILESKNISKIEIEYKEQELANLKQQVESLQKQSRSLKKELSELEKANQVLVSKKEESLTEISELKKKIKDLNNDLQNRVMSQVRQKDACWGLIQSKQEIELELEKIMGRKYNIEDRINEVREKISQHENKITLEIMLSTAEQKFYIASQKLLTDTYSYLKWTERNIEHQYLLMDQAGDFKDEPRDEALREERTFIRNKFIQVLEMMNSVFENVDNIERKCSDVFTDSLEEVPVANKTFEIINLDEKMNDRTFSIKNDAINFNFSDSRKIDKPKTTTWVVSPPGKPTQRKEFLKSVKKERKINGESWVVPAEKPIKESKFHSTSELSVKSVVPAKNDKPSMSKSSSFSSITEVDYSPPNKRNANSNQTASFHISQKHEHGRPEGETFLVERNLSTSMDSKLNKVGLDSNAHCAERFHQDNLVLEKKIWDLQRDLLDLTKERDRLKVCLNESEQKRKTDKENFDNDLDAKIRATAEKYERKLEQLKSEMKILYNREMAKNKAEQAKLMQDLREQNKAYKEHNDEMKYQLWELGEKLLHEQKLRRDSERNLSDMRKRYQRTIFPAEQDSKTSHGGEFLHPKDVKPEEASHARPSRPLASSSFPTIPTEDEDEVFDNRCLEDMKAGRCHVDGPEGRLTELQIRNSMCLPHLKSSYPAETQFHNPGLYKENDLKFGQLNFGQESQSLTDSDHSMTRSLLPDERTKKKEQTSYKRPGPPTPSKNGGRHSLQGAGDLRLTPKNILKESNELTDKSKGTPSRLKSLFSTKSSKRDSFGYKDENSAPGTPRGKKLKLFRPRKPFGGREY